MSLASHISGDPDSRGYAQMTDREVYEDLLVKRRSGERQMSYKDLMGTLGAASGRRLIDSMKAAAQSDSVVETWHNMLTRGETININNVEVKAMLQTFADNVNLPLTQADHDSIVGLEVNQVSDAEFYGFNNLDVHQVINARS